MMKNNYCQIVPQTDDEKRKMYMRLSKEELVEMLINANKIIDMRHKGTSVVLPSKRWAPCKTWEDCANPHKDCIGCPLQTKSYSQESSLTTNLK
jgi:hypothetical protein